MYDECEDHYSQLKALQDDAAGDMFVGAIEQCLKVDLASDSAVNALIASIKEQTRATDSQYFRTAFPAVYN